MKRRILSALCCILMLSVLSTNVFAIEVPDLERTGSISVTMTYEGNAVPGGSLTLYRVASVAVENGADYSFRYTQSYENCQVSLDDLDTPDTAKALAEYTAKNGISGTTAQIDENGKVKFEDLELGLYLMVQQEPAEGYEPANPFLTSVPAYQDESYIYEVDASPKLSLELAPTEPTETTTEPTEPTTPDIPQTGLNQWPIPVMAIGGLFLTVLGLMLYSTEKKRSHES